MTMMERLIHKTKDNPHPKYDFDDKFYKFPSEYRRDAIAKADALVKSYKSNLERWDGNGKKPKRPRAGYSCDIDALVRAGMLFVRVKKGNWVNIRI